MNSTTRTVVWGLFAAILAAALAAVYLLWQRQTEQGEERLGGIENFVPRPHPIDAPPVTFLDAEGRTMHLSDFRGSLVLVNLWATWCAPCIRELPSLDRLQQQLEPVGVKVVALSIDRGGPAVVKRYFAENGIKHLAVYVDPTMQAQNALNVPGLPTSILIDREGRERGHLVGAIQWDDADAADLVLRAAGPPAGR